MPRGAPENHLGFDAERQGVVTTRDARKPAKGADARRRARPRRRSRAIGLEAEFAIVVDGQPAKPEDVFGSPTHIVRAPMMHRTGRSYHLPTGGAVYFDTGVIEIATPVIEIERGCAARAGRSLWESIRFLRNELDAWEEREGHTRAARRASARTTTSRSTCRRTSAADRTVEQARDAADAHHPDAGDAARGEPPLDRHRRAAARRIASRSRPTSRRTPRS